MRTILTIAKRELTRLRSRFRGGSRPLVLLVLAGAFVLAFLVFRQMPVVGESMYRVGVSPDGPRVQDSRFNTVTLDRSSGYALLNKKVLDVYIDGARVVTRNDQKSQYAAGALKRYLEKRELARINAEYDLARAFPLRVEINTLTATAESALPIQGPTLADLIGPWPPPPVTPQPGSPGQPPLPSESDTAVREQIKEAESGSGLPQIKIESASNKRIIIPSLTNPPIPFAQVLLAFVYILPVSFVSVFFTSSFMDEKTNRRLTILMSAPVTPFQIIAGKMLPYVVFSFAAVAVVALATQANVGLALAIFCPAILFIFAIYLMVPLLYRTFKDTTFISMLATAVTTSYLIFPAMFSGINDLAYISPLTLAVKMYRGEPFGWREYLFATTPMYLLFALSMYVGTRVLNEEFLMGYRPLYRKVADAIYLSMNRSHPYLSIMALSLLLIPMVYMIQLVTLALSLNLPIPLALAGTLVVAAVVEEIAKSVGIAVLLEHQIARSVKQVIALSLLSALGFLIGEKALLYVSLSVVSQSALSAALFGSGLLLGPLVAHFVFTTIVCLLTSHAGVRYRYAVLAGAIAHSLYNLLLVGGMLR
jgi:ABC-type Na+ efflux pump permease subunit